MRLLNKTTKIKSAHSGAVDIGADIALINKHSIKELAPEDVFTFSAILCDNQIDRDLECFSDATLDGLSKLFIGKTGIFNHAWDAKDQVSRVYKTELERDGETTRLRAYAYIMRGESNDEIIKKIEGGILKEVSVGVSIEKSLCSICGGQLNSPDCKHYRGREYDGKTCHGILEGALDAYEFSFVAVPAQRGAGVTKSFGEPGQILDALLEDLNKCPGKLEALREKLAPSEPPPDPPSAEPQNKSCDYAAAMAAFFAPKTKGE